MNFIKFKLICISLIVVGLFCNSVFAVEYYLRAEQTTITMPGGEIITMWGFAQDSSFGAMDGTVQIPGPQLVVPADDPNLVIYLDNNLAEPVSIVIPGQNGVVSPVKFTDDQGRKRIRSFTNETPVNNAVAVKYEWKNFKPGTFLYHSASHPAVQVQMGLYGCVKKDALTLNLGAAGQYNMVVFQDAYQHESSSQGNIAVGNNAWFQNFGIAASLSGDAARLVVGGNITSFDSGSIGSNPVDANTLGNIYVFGNSNLNLVGYKNLVTGDSGKFDFAASKNYLLEASAYWAALTPNGTAVADGGSLTLTGTNSALNIFSVSGTDFSNSTYFVINVPAGSTVLVNVGGTNVLMQNFGSSLTGATSNRILYNFYQATFIDIENGSPMGSILAPKADVDFTNGHIEGTLIAKSLGTLATQSNGGAENFQFTGSLPILTTKQAYDGTFYDDEVVLLFSEIDPALHKAVADGNYGADKPITSTIDYNPRYFLMNGQPFTSAMSPIAAGQINKRILVRFLNIGLEVHTPVIQNAYMNILAEDGHKYKYSKQQYSIIMPPAKTKDAMLTVENAGMYPIYDRRLALTNNKTSGGGMMRFLEITEPGGEPLAEPVVALYDIATQWLSLNCTDCSADLNGDLTVNFKDFVIFAQNYMGAN